MPARQIKFTHKIGDKTFSITFYENQTLKMLKGIRKKIHPIYLRISFNKKNVQVRSILWHRLMLTNDLFFGIKQPKKEIIEAYTNLELLLKNEELFNDFCEYEFECIIRIIAFQCRNKPKDVGQIVNAYDHLGQDGLRQICKVFIQKFLEKAPKMDPFAIKSIGKREHPPLSNNLFSFLRDSLTSMDPVRLICIMDEFEMTKLTDLDESLSGYFDRLTHLISILIFGYSNVRTSTAKLSPFEITKSLGLLYFPKIHFYYPISSDMSTRESYLKGPDEKLLGIDLLKFQKYLD